MAIPPNPLRSFLIFTILSALFILSLFYRVSNAVIAPNLIHDLSLNAETLGILGGAYFYSFTLLQIPLGPMLDRMGLRLVITAFPLIGAAGSFLFAFGESFATVFIGRMLIGTGMSCILVGSMKVFTLRFPAKKFTTLTGLLLSVGTLGNIFATSPLAILTATIGWRKIFLLAGVITMLLSFLVFWILGEEKRNEEAVFPISSNPEVGILQSLRSILKSLAFWQMGVISFFRYGTLISLQGLWFGPFLIDVKGYSPVQTGNVLILTAIGTILGGPIAGRLTDRTFHSKKNIATVGMSLYALSLFPLIGILKIQDVFWYGLIFFFMGFFSAFGLAVYSHAKDLFPDAISGTVMTLINFFTMAGAAVLMPVLGRIIEYFPRVNHAYPAKAYHFAFLICFLGMTASIIFYAISKRE